MTEKLGQIQGSWDSVRVIRVWDIQPSWVNVPLDAPGCILLRLGNDTKWHFCCTIFRILSGHRKSNNLTESKNVFAEVFQITINEKKKLGD